MKIPTLRPITIMPRMPMPQPITPSCCQRCGAQTRSPFGDGRVIHDVRTCHSITTNETPQGKQNMTAAEINALTSIATQARARRDAQRHRQAVDAGRTDQRRAATAMTGVAKQA